MLARSIYLSVLVTLCLQMMPVYSDEFQTFDIKNTDNQTVGFIDEDGLYHELAGTAASDTFQDPGNLTEPPVSFLSALVEDPVSAASDAKTIDKMTFSNYSYDTYGIGGKLLLIDDANQYILNDGSSWGSGAGSHSSSGAYVDHVETDGNTLRFYLSNPSDFHRTDYNSGDHSAQGTLRPLLPLVIETTAGSTTGKLTGGIELVSNDATWYGEPRFNYFSAPVGAVLPIEITYTLLNGATFHANLFDTSFRYQCSGWVDFANPILVPLPVSLEINGSPQVFENSIVQYTAAATYNNGVVKNVTESAVWSAAPGSLASIDQGLLATGTLATDEETIILTAIYEEDGVSVSAELAVTCLPKGSIFPDNSWPMFQGNKEHNGCVPISLDTADFTKMWEHHFGRALHPIAAADDKVFVSTPSRFQDADSLFVLDNRDGELLWSKNLGTASSVNPPSYAYGNVYIQTGKGTSSPPPYVSAFDAETGDVVFRATYSAQWESHYAPTIYKGSVYVNGGYYGGMYRYDAFDGTQKWFRSLAQYDEWTPAVDDNYAYAYVGGTLSIVDRLNGQVTGTIQDPGFDWHGWSMDSAPVLGHLNDILVGQDGRLICFDLSSKTMKYAIPGSYTNQPSVGDGCVYAINGGSLAVHDEGTGTFLWGWTPPEGKLTGTLIVTNTHVLTATSANTYAVELLARDADWSYPAAGHLALGNETLYIAGSSGLLTAISVPEYIPAKPVSLQIDGPHSVQENSQVQYTATVTYEDGRIRDRTKMTAWSLDPNLWGDIDAFGLLMTKELQMPLEKAVLSATYCEDEYTLTESFPVTILFPGTPEQLAVRNLEKALQSKEIILHELQQALMYEQASSDIVHDLNKEQKYRNRNSRGSRNQGHNNHPDRNKTCSRIDHAIVFEKLADRFIRISIQDLFSVLDILAPDGEETLEEYMSSQPLLDDSKKEDQANKNPKR